MCITKACEDPTSPGVWWRDDAEWKPSDDAMSAAIMNGLAERATNRVELGTIVSPTYACGTQYVVDLISMTQINVASGNTRDVKLVKAPAAVATTPPLNAPSGDIASVQEDFGVLHESTITSLKSIRSLK